MNKNIDIAELRNDLTTYGSLPLEIKWSISRGRDTYGYNICSLYVYGQKVATCNGGGYDMIGTVIGEFVTALFKDELLKLSEGVDIPDGGGCLNGACGEGSVTTILNAIGYDLHWKDSKHRTLTRLIPREEV